MTDFPSEVSREGLTVMQWVMREHTRLQGVCNDLWDELDGFQNNEEFQGTLVAYHRTCDRMDVLENLPECAFSGHPVVIWASLNHRWCECLREDCARISEWL